MEKTRISADILRHGFTPNEIAAASHGAGTINTVNDFLLKVIMFAMAAALLCGCQTQQKKNAEKISEHPDLKLSSVAQFIRSDGSRYLTHEGYKIYSNPPGIEIFANEPFGQIMWSVQNGKYEIEKNIIGKSYDAQLYSRITDKNIAECLFEIYLAGLGKVSLVNARNEPLSFEGQVFECVSKNSSGVKLYRNKRTNRIDLAASGQYVIHGYNYQKIDDKDNFYPSKLDIYVYHTDFDKELIAQISNSLK